MGKNKMKTEFYESIGKMPQKSNSFHMTLVKYHKLVNEVKAAKTATRKENRHFWLLKHYDVITINTVDKLIAPLPTLRVLYYVAVEELFEILYEAHVSIGHGGRDKMKKYLHQCYKNITGQDIQIFLNLCEFCLKKRRNDKKDLTVKPIIFTQFNSRCLVDVIDRQSEADGDFKFILVYQDHLTKFVVLRALKNKDESEVAEQLLDIFLLFGAPFILQSNIGREFVNKIIENLHKLWPELKIVHGKPGRGQSKSNQDIKNMLNIWMEQEQCSNWSKGLRFVQFMKNRALHAGIKTSPFEAMFGQPAKVGLTSSSLPRDVINEINDEEDLEKLLEDNNVQEQNVIQDSDVKNEILEEQTLSEVLLEEEESAIRQDRLVEKQLTSALETEDFIFKEKKYKICEASLNSVDNDVFKPSSQLRVKNASNRSEPKQNLENQPKRMKRISGPLEQQTES